MTPAILTAHTTLTFPPVFHGLVRTIPSSLTVARRIRGKLVERTQRRWLRPPSGLKISVPPERGLVFMIFYIYPWLDVN